MIERSANRSILAVGSIALDDVEGPYGRRTELLGGSATYFTLAASYFTRNVAIVGVVGEDFPQAHIELFRQRGIDVAGIQRVPGHTFRWAGRYSADLTTRETIATELGVFAQFRPELGDRHRGADLVFLGNIDPVLQSAVLGQIRAPQLVAADTMNYWITGKPKELAATLAKIDTLIINDEEVRLLAAQHNLVRAAAHIRAMGPHSLVVKRGDAGALLFSAGEPFFAPALPLEDVRDPTGAGDSFAGGFVGYLAYAGNLEPETIRNAMIAGSVMASFCVEQFSVEGLCLLRDEIIQARCDAFSHLSQYDSITL